MLSKNRVELLRNDFVKDIKLHFLFLYFIKLCYVRATFCKSIISIKSTEQYKHKRNKQSVLYNYKFKLNNCMHYIHFFLNIMKIIEIIIVHKSNHLWRKKKQKNPIIILVGMHNVQIKMSSSPFIIDLYTDDLVDARILDHFNL